MNEEIKKFIDENWDDCIIKNESSFRLIKIMNSYRDIIVSIDYDDKNQIRISGQNYNKDVKNYVIDKIKSLILNEIIVNNEIYIDKDTSYKKSFKRKRYMIAYRLRSDQFNKSSMIERAILIIEKNRFTDKIVKASIIYGSIVIPISISETKIKFI